MIRLILIFTFVLSTLLFAVSMPAAAQAETVPAFCTKGRAQVMACPGGRCEMLMEYSKGTLLLPNGPADTSDILAWLPISDPLTGQQGYVQMIQITACEVAPWQMRPVVPAATGRTREIYAHGLAMGNNPRVFIRVGNCQSVSNFFLGPFDTPRAYNLGPYTNLQGVIDQFAGSFARQNMTSNGGFNVASVLSPVWSDPKQCNADESPLDCEYRLQKPSFAFVNMEVRWSDSYESYLRQIVDKLIAQGVVPILGTKADNIEGGHRVNAATVRVADEYGLPLWNLWLAAQAVPNHGLQADRFHLTFGRNLFGDSRRLRLGWPARNLTALQTLDSVWRGVQ